MSSIKDDLETIDNRLAEIQQERRELLARRDELLQSQADSQQIEVKVVESRSTSEKVDLFMSLFKGRDDVYALRWENRQGRSGYSIACSNEWQAGVCHKPKIKCGECSNQSFKSLGENGVFGHLAGRTTIGLYPLLSDDHCWLLAVDFDRSDWQQAVQAFRKACASFFIPCAVERSRSGKGAHAWIFFDSPMTARDARRLGFALLDKAMETHAELSFHSYDRLFPNQDTMPNGGFGNLIALPMQNFPRKQGNSVFVDEDFEVYPDQWEFLASLPRASTRKVHECLEQIENADKKTELELKPWEKNLPIEKSLIAGCPDTVSIVLANKIYLSADQLPQALLARLKRLASFSNPVFFKTQALRFSTNGIPRFISLANIDDGYLSLPRGCLDEVVALLSEQSIEVQLDDKRTEGKRLRGLKLKGTLREEQKKAVREIEKHEVGVLHAPTAFGKTVTAIGLIHKRKVNTLVLVHSRQLLDQWKERISMFLEGVDVGVIAGGKRKPAGSVDIATYQSMIQQKDNTENPRLFDYGQIVVDECHHLSAAKYELLLSEIHAKYVVGVTATPQRRDGLQPIIFMQAGPIRHTVKPESQSEFEQRVIVRELHHSPPEELMRSDTRPHIADIYRWLANSQIRNEQIISDVLFEITRKRNPIVLTERREHATALGEQLAEKGVRIQILRGAMKARERKAAIGALSDAQVLIATGKYVGEGFDLPKLDTLFLALPISWKGSLVQYAGRIHRQSTGKERVTIYDYVDCKLPTLQRMYQRRSKGYDAMGYTIAKDHDTALVQSRFGFGSIDAGNT